MRSRSPYLNSTEELLVCRTASLARRPNDPCGSAARPKGARTAEKASSRGGNPSCRTTARSATAASCADQRPEKNSSVRIAREDGFLLCNPSIASNFRPLQNSRTKRVGDPLPEVEAGTKPTSASLEGAGAGIAYRVAHGLREDGG